MIDLALLESWFAYYAILEFFYYVFDLGMFKNEEIFLPMNCTMDPMPYNFLVIGLSDTSI